MLTELDKDLDKISGTVSAWFGGLDGAAHYSRNAHVTHYAASTMKVAVMAAAYRMADAGDLDLDQPVDVHNEFTSATGSGTFANERDYDNDPDPWRRLGQSMPLRRLIRHMITRSSNLSTNLVLEHVGFDALHEVWALSGAKHSQTMRGIEDYSANEAGLTNLVTAADLASLMLAINDATLAGAEASDEMLAVLRAQEANEPLAHGLPEGVETASKSGWVDGVRHSMAIITPPDAAAFVLTTCVSTDGAGDDVLSEIVTRVTKAAWASRQAITAG